MRTLLVITVLLTVADITARAGEDADHWSFQKPTSPAVPDAKTLKHGDRVRNPVDAFVLARLEKKGLSPAPLADKRTLARRAYFDLLGLPPTPEQVEKFANDASTSAWPKLVDELLQSKHYGERWGRHWLDVARYADSGGYEADIHYRNAWRYRDYVVKSFNDDKPYDIFVQEQIAGDELWPDDLGLDPKRVYHVSPEKTRHLEARIGTGLFTFGPLSPESALDARLIDHEIRTDWVDTAGSVFLGLTIQCARCHEHKFDPISQKDYYSLHAIFASSKRVDFRIVTGMHVNDWRYLYPKVLIVDEAIKKYRLFEKNVAGRKLTTEEEKEKQRLIKFVGQKVLELPETTLSVPRTRFDPLLTVPSVTVLGHKDPALLEPVRFLDRGELARAREEVPPAIPEVLAEATDTDPAIPGPFGSRKALALWLTGPDHPLTSRVMANRIWGWHFGQGLVSTPNDFGHMGQPPSHPELLDWLATEFVKSGWSIKELHRLIMLSSTYQMDSHYGTEEHLDRDPENRLLWRMNRRRLEGEAIWDSVHAVAGTINLKMGGRPVVPLLAEDEIASLRERWQWPTSADPAEHTRRGLYVMVRRNFHFPMFEVFDAPVNSTSCPERSVTTVAPQALWSLNNGSVFRQAKAFSKRVMKEAGKEPVTWIKRAWSIALARPPTEKEAKEALAFLERISSAESGPDEAALTKLCLGLYNLNEFAFID